jgi:hypothetical protein
MKFLKNLMMDYIMMELMFLIIANILVPEKLDILEMK